MAGEAADAFDPGQVQEFISHSEAETGQIVARLAPLLSPGDVVALRGDLGAGKTVIVKAIAAALGATGPVTSPSFTLMNRYDTPAMPIYHFDFYRIGSAVEALGIGVDEYLQGDGVCLIEWPEKIEQLLPDSYYDISIGIPDYAGSPHLRRLRMQKVVLKHAGAGD